MNLDLTIFKIHSYAYVAIGQLYIYEPGFISLSGRFRDFIEIRDFIEMKTQFWLAEFSFPFFGLSITRNVTVMLSLNVFFFQKKPWTFYHSWYKIH